MRGSAALQGGDEMGRKHHKTEKIVDKLRQVEVMTAQGKPVIEAVRAIGGDGGDRISVACGVWRPEAGLVNRV